MFRRSALLLVTPLFLAACTSETIIVQGSPADDAGVDASDDSSSDPDTVVPGVPALGVCDATHSCDANTVCLTLAGAKAGVCSQKCTSTSECKDSQSPDDAKCADVGGGDKACVYTCVFTGTCPGKLVCASYGGCVPNCKTNAGACGSNFVCSNGGKCADPPPPACTVTPTSGITGTKVMTTLSSSEKGTLCDWEACQLGGYGTSISCDSGIAANPKASQQACLSSFPGSACTATVAQVEACSKTVAANRCNVATALASAECQAVKSCF